MLRRVNSYLACLAAGACLTASLTPPSFGQEPKRAARRAERAAEAKKDKPAADPAAAKPPVKAVDSPVIAATPVDKIKLLPGFKAELLYSVPAETQGSWVSMCVDNKGRLITCDQYGKLYRSTVSAPGVSPVEFTVEPIAESLDIGMAQGLLYAFDSLYVMVNTGRKKDANFQGPGLYRLQDTDGDDKFDKLTLLIEFQGPLGEHGPHAVILSPDGKSLYLAAGNHTEVPKQLDSSLVPRNWGEDFLLTRLWDATGHARGRMAPGGYILRTDPEAKRVEMVSSGYRNQYDMAFNPDGELFTYDADMEWDVGSPWYRPTRVNHATSGSEFGWRSGTGKWPADYPDSLGSVVDIGPGSPTGVTFGTGARFPEKYQRALYISDWSYGTIYAVHMTPDGSSYTGEAEKFALAQPLPVTDMVIHPDGSMYVAIGGRKTQSGLYRLTYTGSESTAPAAPIANDEGRELRELRYSLERLHGAQSKYTVDLAWPYLAHPDRAIRYAARIAIEHQPVEWWADRALAEENPVATTQAIIALARNGKPEHHAKAIEALNRVGWKQISDPARVDLLRAYQLVFIRLGKGSDESRKSVLAKLDGQYPSPSGRVNLELCKQLVYLEAPGVVKRTLALLDKSLTQEEQISYLLSLMELKADWTEADRKAYFGWFNKLASSRGGKSFIGFIRNIRQGAIDSLNDGEKVALKDVIETKFEAADPAASGPPRPFVQKWKVEELVADLDNKLEHRNFEKGRELFSAANCFKCHRVKLEGGSTGPDLTGVAGRFSNLNLLESVIQPSKVVSDQYEKMQFQMADGRVIEGRVINLNGDNLMVLTNMYDPDSIVAVKRSEVEESQVSKTSMMPEGLLDTLTKDEILDLMAYLKSGGNPQSALFEGSAAGK
ncbi:Cytochrome c [Caulifigura coniformis]|uniref:Cytochrome c n=1 Tax=Caulifigura coniformis TaxID=2527983 RepID=A0A517S7E4_9PLAN|nr:c-type cytochrome [Caulifigura coniformis]QDT52042.1 Cytochrome c [Caulifigura coniformis]